MKTGAMTFQISGQPLLSTAAVPLQTGWNLVGYQGSPGTPILTAMQALETNLDIVFGFDASKGGITSYFADPVKGRVLNNLDTVDGMQGYWLHITGGTSHQWRGRWALVFGGWGMEATGTTGARSVRHRG